MSNHWYDGETGEPAYTYINSKGEEKDTTLRQARTMNLWPSVTTVIAGAASPGLDYYRQEQLCLAAWDEPIKPDMSYEIWRKRVVEKSKQHAGNAANRGNEIHNLLEQYYTSPRMGVSEEDYRFIAPIIQCLGKEFPNAQWIAEASFCSPLGFGGKVDLHDPVNRIVLDFKTKDTDDIKKMVAYDGHHMQTAAYAVGLSLKKEKFTTDLGNELEIINIDLDSVSDWKRYNLFISTQIPGLLNLTESKDFDREWGMFKSLLRFWQLSNKYEPSYA